MDKKNIREIAFYVITTFVLALNAYTLHHLFSGEMPTNNNNAIMLVIGNITTWGGMVVGYWFGSSKGSADKSETIERINTPDTDPVEPNKV